MNGNPTPAFRFTVEIENILHQGWFTECSGLKVQRGVEDVVQVGQNSYIHKLAGRYSAGEITLKHGLFAADQSLWDWLTQDINDTDKNYRVKRHTVTISLHSVGGVTQSARQWVFENAFPSQWTLNDLAATSGKIVLETLTLSFGGGDTQADGGGAGASGETASGEHGDEKDDEEAVDVNRLAELVYHLFRHELRVDYERRGRHNARLSGGE